MKHIAALTALLLVALAVPATAQTDEEPVIAYACIAYEVDPIWALQDEEPDPYSIIPEGEWEWVNDRDCITQPESPQPWKDLKLRIKGEKKTKPFFLPEGDYEVVVKRKGAGCKPYGNVRLYELEDDWQQESFEETDYLFGVEEGLYYFEGSGVSSYRGKCAFTIIVKQFAY